MTALGTSRHRPIRRPRRRIAAVLVGVYALGAWALPFAHALAFDGDRVPESHVESQGRADHPPIHDSLDCTIFSVARLVSAPARPVAAPCDVPVASAAGPHDAAAPAHAAPSSGHDPRAPPVG